MGWRLDLRWMGRTFSFDEVEASLTETWDFFAKSPDVREVSFTDLFFPPDVDPAALVAAGHRLTGATASLVLDGITHLIGLVDSPRFGRAGAPVAFSVREATIEDGGTIPGAFAVDLYSRADLDKIALEQERRDFLAAAFRSLPKVAAIANEAPFPTIAPESQGRTYTVVFGAPGAGGYPASPAPVISTTVGDERLLVAGHECTVGTVTVWGPDINGDLTSGSVVVQNVTDAFGRRVCIAIIAGLTNVDESRTDEEFWIGWNGTASGLSSGAGDVLMTVLRHTTLRLDFARLRTVIPILNQRYQLSGYIDEQITPAFDWISDQLLPILPITPVWGRDGLYFALWNPEQPPVDIFVAGPEFVPDPHMQYSAAKVMNEFILSYRFRTAPKEQYSAVAVADRLNSAYAAISQQTYGLRSETFESDIIEDQQTADRIALDQVRLRGFAPLLLGADCSRTRYDRRAVGEVVSLSVPDLSLSSRPAHITAITRDGGPILRLEFALIDDPLRV